MKNLTGKVKWFDRVKGYGFITPDRGGQDVFAHYSKIVGGGYRNLTEGARVTYDEIDHGRGPAAINIRQR